jgi:uncharacterized protein YjgD (DUF1641 family)
MIRVLEKDKKPNRGRTRAPGGQNIGALRTKNPTAFWTKDVLDTLRTEMRLPTPNQAELHSLGDELYRATAARLLLTADVLKAKGPAAALDHLSSDQQSIMDYAKKIRAESDKRIAKLVEETKALKERVEVDKIGSASEDLDMATITREEFDAKLETIEARMDGRVTRIEGKIDALLTKIEGSAKRSEETEKVFRLLSERAGDAANTAANAATKASELKSSLWITSITTILSVLGIAIAAYFGTQQSNQAIVQTMLAAFDSGKGMNVQPTPPAAPVVAPKK